MSVKKLIVGLVQITDEFSDGQCYLPLSVGYMQAYVKKYVRDSSSLEFLIPIYKYSSVQDIVAKLLQADLVGFSVYVWNFERTCAIARELKRQKPEVIILFGGPHVPDGLKRFGHEKKVPGTVQIQKKRLSFTETFHRKYPFVDIACHGEGETVFLDIVERMLDGSTEWQGIASTSYVNKNGIFVQNPRRPRIVDLAVVPSPYQSGTFDDLIQTFPDQLWITLLETNRGCPYSCTFCDWAGGLETQLTKFPLEHVYADIEWFGKHKIRYVFVGDANFGILPRDVDIAKEFARVRGQYGYPKAIATQNAKNPKPHSFVALNILDKAGLKTAGVMSIQSTNQETLELIRRDNMNIEAYQENQYKAAADGTLTVSDMIMCLPAETYASFADGVAHHIFMGQHNRIAFNIYTLLPNAESSDPEYIELHGLKTINIRITVIHGKKQEAPDGIYEMQEIVIGSKTMPTEEWVHLRVFTWMVTFLHFNKLLQIPLVAMDKLGGIGYRDMVELFSDGKYTDTNGNTHSLSETEFPALTSIRKFFYETAEKITQGSEEYCHSKEWLDIWWPADEYVFIKLCVENKLADFYGEAERALRLLRDAKSAPINDEQISDAVTFNHALLKFPFQSENLNIKLGYKYWEFYQDILLGKPATLEAGPVEYCIDRTTETWNSWDDWFLKVVWWCNRNGAYLYTTKQIEPVPSGHYF